MSPDDPIPYTLTDTGRTATTTTSTKRPRLAVPLHITGRLWAYRDSNGAHRHVPLDQPITPDKTPGSWETQYQAGPCTWCGWTSSTSCVKVAVTDEARQHRDTHRREGR